MSVADEFADAFKSVTKDLRAEKKRRDRDARKTRNAATYRTTYSRMTLKAAVYEVIADAAAAASENGRYQVPARNLYYAVRPRVQQIITDELSYKYFDKVLVDYQHESGPIRGLYRDPRGELLEPHTATTVPLGTREVAGYTIPQHLYSAILYIEKEGFGPILRESQLAERYDLAIASGKGQPVEAVRALFARAERGDYRLFVLHDADPAGYSIARTIATATKRMPHHRVDVIDLGLTVDAAIEHDMPTEQFTRSNALPYWMPPQLTDTEREWFEGDRIFGRQHECTRVELNAFTPSDLIGYIEAGLDQAGVDKVVPPAEAIDDTATAELRDVLGGIVDEAIGELIDRGSIVDTLTAESRQAAVVDRGDVTAALADHPPTRWTDDVETRVQDSLDETRDQLRERARNLIAAHLEAGGAR